MPVRKEDIERIRGSPGQESYGCVWRGGVRAMTTSRRTKKLGRDREKKR